MQASASQDCEVDEREKGKRSRSEAAVVSAAFVSVRFLLSLFSFFAAACFPPPPRTFGSPAIVHAWGISRVQLLVSSRKNSRGGSWLEGEETLPLLPPPPPPPLLLAPSPAALSRTLRHTQPLGKYPSAPSPKLGGRALDRRWCPAATAAGEEERGAEEEAEGGDFAAVGAGLVSRESSTAAAAASAASALRSRRSLRSCLCLKSSSSRKSCEEGRGGRGIIFRARAVTAARGEAERERERE